MTHDDDVPAGPHSADALKVTRRAFVGLSVVGAVAALAPQSVNAAPKKKVPAANAETTVRTPEIRDGIAAQKRSLAQSLEKLRAFPLEAGSWPAFGFRPMKAGRPR